MSKLSQGVVFVFLLAVMLVTSPFYVQASTEVYDDIVSDTTWNLIESPYIVNFPTTVSAGATLSIDPGVVVKFESTGQLIVEGVLDAVGTSSDLVYFTSIKDDSVGGDTNADGSATLPQVSDWRGISFSNPSMESRIVNAQINFADFGISNEGSNVLMSDAIFQNINSGLVTFGGDTTLKNISFDNVLSFALALFDDSIVTADTISITGLGAFNEVIDVYDNANLTLRNSFFAGSDAFRSYGLLVFSQGSVDVEGSIFSNFDAGVIDFGEGGASIKIHNSQIKDNNDGIVFYSDDSSISISGNTIHNNHRYGVQHYGEYALNLKNNFWGDATGPYNEETNVSGLGNAVYYYPGYNNILYNPWLATWPSDPIPCCSSVIFVPGFEGSRLYERRGNGESQFWDPRSPSDISNLFLNNNGSSVSNIYTRDIVESVPVLGDIYKTIQTKLEGFKNIFDINDWSAYAYDWRMSASDLVISGTKYQQQVKKLEVEVESLAMNSKTEKVTLIGHSNGGLMIKKLIAELKKNNKHHLVDKIILVNSPQLGTPSALSVMLHGYGTKLGFGLVLREGRAREWLLNMNGAYGLIPSSKLMAKIEVPVIELDPSVSNITNWLNRYGPDVDYADMKNLITGGDGRSQPNRLNLNIPYVLRANLFTKSEQLHNEIDNLQIPSSIEVHEIAGWGLPTVTGIRYDRTPQLFSLSNNINLLRSKAIFTYKGDKQVILDSQVDYGFNKYYLDILGYNNDEDADFSHANIMENPEVLSIIENIIIDSSKTTPHITNDFPELDEYATPKYKIISMHSPADIDIYDESGRHTGIDADYNSSNSDLIQIETGIPNSDFFIIGEEKYAVVPDDGENYNVKVSGTGSGLFTLTIETQQGDTIVDKVEYANLPVTNKLEAEIVIPSDGSEATLSIDHNGDGIVDEEVLPNTDTNPVYYLEIIRTTILELNLSKHKEKQLLLLVDNIHKLIKKGKVDKATKKMQNFLHRIQLERGPIKDLSSQERNDLVEKINNFLSSL